MAYTDRVPSRSSISIAPAVCLAALTRCTRVLRGLLRGYYEATTRLLRGYCEATTYDRYEATTRSTTGLLATTRLLTDRSRARATRPAAIQSSGSTARLPAPLVPAARSRRVDDPHTERKISGRPLSTCSSSRPNLEAEHATPAGAASPRAGCFFSFLYLILSYLILSILSYRAHSIC